MDNNFKVWLNCQNENDNDDEITKNVWLKVKREHKTLGVSHIDRNMYFKTHSSDFFSVIYLSTIYQMHIGSDLLDHLCI